MLKGLVASFGGTHGYAAPSEPCQVVINDVYLLQTLRIVLLAVVKTCRTCRIPFTVWQEEASGRI